MRCQVSIWLLAAGLCDSHLPADARTLFDGIATSDRFIFKAARPQAAAVPLVGRLSAALSVAVSALDRVAAPVPLTGRLSAAMSVAAVAPDRVTAAAVPLVGRLSAALSVAVSALDRVAAPVPLTGRLSAALSVAASVPVAVAPDAVPLTGRLSAALTVAACRAGCGPPGSSSAGRPPDYRPVAVGKCAC